MKPFAEYKSGADHAAFYDHRWAVAHADDRIPVDPERCRLILDYISGHLRPESVGRSRIIDVGCGVGWIASRLVRFGAVTGVDLSAAGVEIARETVPKGEFYAVDIMSPESAKLGIFDVAVCSEVIEHVSSRDKPAFAESLARLVAPGGLLVLTTPNGLASRHWWRLPNSHEWKQPIEEWLTPRELLRLFKPYFRASAWRTFSWDFSHDGLYRIVNSVKMNAAADTCGLHHAFNSLKARWCGLYTIVAFVRHERH